MEYSSSLMDDCQHKPHLKVASVEVESILVEKQLHECSVSSHRNVVERGQPKFGREFR